jgi:hypothetical protein
LSVPNHPAHSTAFEFFTDDEFEAKPIEFESLVATIRRVVANPK